MSSLKVERLLNSPISEVAKGPFWTKGSLFYIDILAGKLHRYDYNANTFYTAIIREYLIEISEFNDWLLILVGENVISFIIPVLDNATCFVIGAAKRLLLINWDGISAIATIEKVLAVLPVEGLRLNDAKADSKGHLYVGTMMAEEVGDVYGDKRICKLYKYSTKKGLVEIKSDVGLSNGIALNEAANKFYFVDSFDLNVKEYDFDATNGTISNEAILTDLTSFGELDRVVPGGLSITAQGMILVNIFGGSRIFGLAPNGKIEMEIPLPVAQVTSMTLGGENLDTMFVTSAATEIWLGPQIGPSGYLFKVTGFKGVTGPVQQMFVSNE